MPMVTKKGPHNRVIPVHSLAEFINVFGVLDADSYDKNGQTALNAYNWLNNGGTLYVVRLDNTGDNKYATYGKSGLKAKYIGDYYANLSVIISKNGEKYTVIVKDGKTELEKLTFKKDSAKNVIATSEYLEIDGDRDIPETIDGGIEEYKHSGTITESLLKDLLVDFWKNTAKNLISNRLETPIDLIMDAGYSKEVKDEMIKFIDNKADELTGEVSSVRPDIVGIFDSYDSAAGNSIELDTATTKHTGAGRNFAVYEQHFTISDEILTDKDIEVTPTYFLAKLLPYNDLAYGVQFPTAGLRRGILDDAKAVNENPTPDKKELWFGKRINYVEKTSREYAFMSQRTYDHSKEDEYTALSFLNNVRALEKMKKELERLGRNYLFEFNDSVTLTQMSSILNKYMSEWVTNRTLSSAVVNVAKNPYSEEAVDITLNIKFNGTIEVISVDITIE